jgi:EmrB/QacA subfamily drug resistance transporter
MENYVIENRHSQNRLIALVCLGAFIANLDATIVNIALPTISKEFQVSPSVVSWTVLAYLLCETGFMLPFGKLADIKGIKAVYLAGFVVFMFGSLLCGLSTNISQLIPFRAVQGVGGALLFTVMMAFIPIYLPSERRLKTTGLVTTAAAAGVAFGPPIGGWITALFGWRWIFFVNIPFCLAAIYATRLYIPSAYPRAAMKRFDYRGSVYSFGALIFFLYAVNRGHVIGWTSPMIVSCFTLSLILAAAFIVREQRIDYPLVDLKLFRNKLLLYSMLAISASLMTVGGVLYLFPFYLEECRKLGTHEAGMIVMLVALGQFVGPFTGKLSELFGIWWLCVLGMLIGLCSFLLFLDLGPLTSVAFIVLSLGLFGLSQGLSKSPNASIIMGCSPPHGQSAVSSIMSVARSLSTALGVLFFETIFSNSIPHHISHTNIPLSWGIKHVNELTPGMQNAFLFGAAVSIIAIVFMLIAGKQSALGRKEQAARDVASG